MMNNNLQILNKLWVIAISFLIFSLFIGESFAGSTIKNKAQKTIKELLFLKEEISITLEPEDFVRSDGLVYPFSHIWREYLARAITRKGIKIVPTEEFATHLISGRYWKEGKNLVVSTKLIDLSNYKTINSYTTHIPWKKVKKFLKPKLSFYARLASGKLTTKPAEFLGKVFIAEPFKFKNMPVYSSFSYLFMEEIKTFLCRQGIKFLNTRSVFRNLRSISVKKQTSKISSTGFYTLSGSFWPEKNQIKVFVKLIDNKQKILSQCQVIVPCSLVSRKNLIPMQNWEPGSIRQEGRLSIHVFPDKGENAIYKEGENIFFTLQLSSQAYVHIYNFNPKGQILLLYPCIGHKGLLPEGVHFLPETEEWQVSPPFGTDRILVFASTTPLILPQMVECGSKLPFSLKELYQYYRTQAGSGIYTEATATIRTEKDKAQHR